MRIIIELDNVAPVTLKVSPTEAEQTSLPTTQMESAEEAVNAGAAPGGDTQESTVGGKEETTATTMQETSAGPAPNL